MAFRVLVIGDREGIDFAKLRDALDALLVHRLPDVEILTAGGPGVPALAASYARSRGLPFTAFTPDFTSRRGDVVERRDQQLITLADAVVAVWVGWGASVRDLVAMARARGKRVEVISANVREPRPGPPPDELRGLRGLPD